MKELKLLNIFEEIREKNWVKGVNNSTNSIGLTFEHLLNKKPDSSFLPDYKGLEIKCTQRYSRFPITLFSIAFDGPNLYEMNNLLEKYGIADKEYNDRKLLMGFLKINQKVLMNDKYYFELKIDYEKEILYINIYDEYFNFLEQGPYINFCTLQSRLQIKLTNMIVVYASKKEIENDKYFRYYKIEFYKLKDFYTFLKLLENDIIKVNLVGRIARSGNEESRQKNKNLVFSIPKDDISLLFNRYISYDTDEM